MNAMRKDVEEMLHVEQVSDRDKRTMNHMDPETKAVHVRLELWASHTRGELRAWPAVSMLGRLIEQGPTGAGQQGRGPTSMSEEDAATDAAVARLGDIDRRVIEVYYRSNISKEDAARSCRMRLRQFQNVLRRARWRIGGFLSAIEGRPYPGSLR